MELPVQSSTFLEKIKNGSGKSEQDIANIFEDQHTYTVIFYDGATQRIVKDGHAAEFFGPMIKDFFDSFIPDMDDFCLYDLSNEEILL